MWLVSKLQGCTCDPNTSPQLVLRYNNYSLISQSCLPGWQGLLHLWYPHKSVFIQGLPHDHSFALQRRLVGGWEPQWQGDKTIFGHGGHGPKLSIFKKQ